MLASSKYVKKDDYMSRFKSALDSSGVVVNTKRRGFQPYAAKTTPRVGLSRLMQLLKSGSPRIAVVRGEGIGDVLMTTPTLHAIKELFGGSCHISYATNTRYLDGALVKTLQYNPDVDEILERELIKDSEFDLVINLHCPCIAHEKHGKPPINRVDLFANHVGINLTDKRLKYYPTKQEIEAEENIFFPKTTTYITKLP